MMYMRCIATVCMATSFQGVKFRRPVSAFQRCMKKIAWKSSSGSSSGDKGRETKGAEMRILELIQ